jgi:hypothetical protein
MCLYIAHRLTGARVHYDFLLAQKELKFKIDVSQIEK